MVQLHEKYNLSDFVEHPMEHVERLRSSGQPEFLSVHGERGLVVQDAEAYMALLDRLEVVETVAAVRESVEQYQRGEDVPLSEGLAMLREKLGVSYQD